MHQLNIYFFQYLLVFLFSKCCKKFIYTDGFINYFLHLHCSLLYWWNLRTQLSGSFLGFPNSEDWLWLDHNELLQQNDDLLCCNMSNLKSLDSLDSRILCEQFVILPELPLIHFAEYLGTWESNCGSNFFSLWCLKLKIRCCVCFEPSESKSLSLFCAYCIIQLIFLLKMFFTSAYVLLDNFDCGQLWFAIKWNFSKQSLCPLNDLVCRRSDFGIP